MTPGRKSDFRSGLQSPIRCGPASPNSSASSLPVLLVFLPFLKQAMLIPFSLISSSEMRLPRLPGADPVLRSWLSLLSHREASRTGPISRGPSVTACQQAEHWGCSLGLREADPKEFGAQDIYEGALFQPLRRGKSAAVQAQRQLACGAVRLEWLLNCQLGSRMAKPS